MGFAKQLNQFSIYGFKLITFANFISKGFVFPDVLMIKANREATHSYKTQDEEIHLQWAF